jgi:hypothetical protein
MDRKEQMRYSLLEVFGLEDDEASPTRTLMDSYGVQPSSIEQAQVSQVKRSAAEVIREAISTGTFPDVEDAEPTPHTKKTQRDDLALQRWREMAGLGTSGGRSDV